ncbi:MAG: hypothetical protein H0U23_07200 [Blastocatellia bacterium]|nr:hypothetical protein [Blastocatellia bacterium]
MTGSLVFLDANGRTLEFRPHTDTVTFQSAYGRGLRADAATIVYLSDQGGRWLLREPSPKGYVPREIGEPWYARRRV